jgi:hypothetical protein
VSGRPGISRRTFRKVRQTHSWAIYHIKSTPARLIGIVDAPDEATAIARAIVEYDVPHNEQGCLIAQRRDGNLPGGRDSVTVPA